MTDKLKGLGLIFGILCLCTLCMYCLFGIAINNKNNENSELSAKNEIIMSQLDLLTENVTTLQENYTILETRYNEAIANNETSQETISELENSLNSTQSQLDTANARIEELVFELNSADPVFGKFVDGTLTEVTAEDLEGITTIRSYAFAYSSITSIEIPEGVTEIGASAFLSCSKLTYVSCPSTLKSIKTKAFYSATALTEVVLQEGLLDIGKEAFKKCSSITTITFPNSLEYVAQDSLELYGATPTATDENFVYYGNSTNPYVIAYRKRQSPLSSEVVIADGCRILYEQVLGGSGHKSVIFPETLSQIGRMCFYSASSLTNLIVPRSCKYISDVAFGHCTNLETIYIPAGVTISSVGGGSLAIFYYCSKNLQIYCEASEKPETFTDTWNYGYNGSSYELPVTWGVSLEEYQELISA